MMCMLLLVHVFLIFLQSKNVEQNNSVLAGFSTFLDEEQSGHEVAVVNNEQVDNLVIFQLKARVLFHFLI